MNDMTVADNASQPFAGPLGFRGLAWDRLVDTLPIGIYMCDSRGLLVQYNEPAAALWGHSPELGSTELTFCGAYRVFELDGRPLERTETPLAEVLRTGQPVRGRELVFERPDGSRIFIQANAEPLFDENGAIHGAVNCLQDITDRRQAENARARDQALLRTVVEATPECIKIVARDGRLLQMNSAGKRMIEAGSDTSVEGGLIYDLIAPESQELWRANHTRVCGGETLTWEFDVIGLNGTRRHMETHAVPLRLPDGDLAQLAITRDVTQSKNDDRTIHESEHRHRALLEALPAAVYTTDLEGRITFFNEAAVEFAGRRPELGDKWCVTWRLYSPDGAPLPHEECPMAVALREQRPVRNEEAIAERPDGSRIWFAPYPTPLRDSSGTMTGAINMLVDISHRKEAERQQKLLIDELNHRVKNTLATVQSLMVQSARRAETIDDYRQTLEARVLAMSRAHDELSRRNWSAADLRDLAVSGLSPYSTSGNIAISGAPIIIPPRMALLLSMVFHELAANATKYGALTQAGGKVDFGWRTEQGDDGRVLKIDWTESGGPPVKPNARRGFGLRLVEQGVSAELNGKARLELLPSGAQCRIELPLDDGR
ncbi:PAS domain S-box protein [Chelatococcus sp. GCM10030263]|uniref:sensor histidine kinase n=1 Tax=Chelatococcus sp. GCM10030263 TaxID=3273387 RepID=UPI00361E898B